MERLPERMVEWTVGEVYFAKWKTSGCQGSPFGYSGPDAGNGTADQIIEGDSNSNSNKQHVY